MRAVFGQLIFGNSNVIGEKVGQQVKVGFTRKPSEMNSAFAGSLWCLPIRKRQREHHALHGNGKRAQRGKAAKEARQAGEALLPGHLRGRRR